MPNPDLLERWLRWAVIVGAAIMGIGALKAVIRGAKLFSQDVSDAMSAVLIPVGGTCVAATLLIGILLLVIRGNDPSA